MQRFQILAIVRSNLKNIAMAIDGTVDMTQELMADLGAIFDARVPVRWTNDASRAEISWLMPNYFLPLFSMTRDVDGVGINVYMGIFTVVLSLLMLMPLVLREPYGLMGLLVAESLPVVPLFPRLLAMTQDVDSVRSNVFLGFFMLAPSVGALMVMLSLRLSVVPCRSGVP